MATIKPRTLGNGETVHEVRFRLGGNGKQITETFNPAKGPRQDLKHALLLKAALEANGHRIPENYVLHQGWVDAATYVKITQAAAELADQPEPPTPILFRDFALEWLDGKGKLESGTAGRYRRIIHNHIIPAFGDVDVRDTAGLGHKAIAKWIKELREGEHEPQGPGPLIPEAERPWVREPLAIHTIRNIHGLLYSILDSAVCDPENQLRTHNPCALTELPSLSDGEGDEEMVFYTPEEAGFFLSHMKQDARDLAEWLFGTGHRFSEATALQVRDFEDLLGPNPRVGIWRAWKQAENGSWYLGAPKTKSSVRRTSLTPHQVEKAMRLIAGKGKKDLVFTGPKGGRWIHSTFYTQRWRHAQYESMRCAAHRAEDHRAGIGRRGYRALTSEHIVWCGCPGQLEEAARVHDARHSQVAWLIAAGGKALAISRRLGHSSIVITMGRYGHLLPEEDENMVAGLATVMDRMGSQRTPADLVLVP